MRNRLIFRFNLNPLRVIITLILRNGIAGRSYSFVKVMDEMVWIQFYRIQVRQEYNIHINHFSTKRCLKSNLQML